MNDELQKSDKIDFRNHSYIFDVNFIYFFFTNESVSNQDVNQFRYIDVQKTVPSRLWMRMNGRGWWDRFHP